MEHATAHTVIESPIGDLTVITGSDGAVSGLHFPRRRPSALPPRGTGGFEAATRQLAEYFNGDRTAFTLPTAPHGDTFQRRVWNLVADIPYGQTRTYGQLATQLGDPGLAREVGAANARNPLCILIPCHRVIGADGALTGYAGGLDRKRFLLNLEAGTETLF